MSRDATQTREAILAAAHRLYLEDGLPGLSMRKVAAEVGVSATALYRHFEDKESMLFTLVKKGSYVFMECLHDGLRGDDPQDRLWRTGAGYLRFALDHPEYYRILFMAPKEHLGFEKLSEQAFEDFAPTFTFLVDRVRECMEAGVLARRDVEMVSAMIWANCHGQCSLFLSGQLGELSREDFTGMYELAVQTFLRGLAPS